MGKVAKLKQPETPTLYLDRQAILAAMPTNWCDDLLTGDKAALPSGYVYSPRDVEKLLLAIRERILALRTSEACDVCKAIVWSDQDACSNCG